MTQLDTCGSIPCVAAERPHINKLWPIYSAHDAIEKTLYVGDEEYEFAQALVSGICGKTGLDAWRLTAPGQRQPEARMRTWFALFARFHPRSALKETTWEYVSWLLSRSHTTLIYNHRQLCGRLSDRRFSQEAYDLKSIAAQLEPKYGAFDISPFCGVERAKGMRA